MMMKGLVLGFIATLAVASVCVTATDRPIIGILSLTDNDVKPPYKSYIPASYVKYLEMGGARVVPLKYTDGVDAIKSQLKYLNGALFTGGAGSFLEDGKLTLFSEVGMAILDEVRYAAANGETWPLWGTCMGFQFIHFLLAYPDTSVLTAGWDSYNLSIPLDFTSTASKSRMFSAAPGNIMKILATQPVTMNNHHSAISIAAFEGTAALNTNLTMLSTNKDRNGKAFVSTVEGTTLPIYATQFHPEKPMFEWNPSEGIDHSDDSVLANSFFPKYFVDQARLNSRKFPSWEEESAALIYNYEPVFTAKEDPDHFDQCYFFE